MARTDSSKYLIIISGLLLVAVTACWFLLKAIDQPINHITRQASDQAANQTANQTDNLVSNEINSAQILTPSSGSSYNSKIPKLPPETNLQLAALAMESGQLYEPYESSALFFLSTLSHKNRATRLQLMDSIKLPTIC